MTKNVSLTVQVYDDHMALKKKIAIVVDGLPDTAADPPPPVSTTSADIPTGLFTFGYIAMKYLVVKAYKGKIIFF